jgi:hypothetical protein
MKIDPDDPRLLEKPMNMAKASRNLFEQMLRN